MKNGKTYRNEIGECLFLQFTTDGYIVVVGAGHDYGLTENERYLNVKIIKHLKKEWSTKAILLFVTGVKQVAVVLVLVDVIIYYNVEMDWKCI